MKFLNRKELKKFKQVGKRLKAYKKSLPDLEQWEKEKWSDNILSDEVREKLKKITSSDSKLSYYTPNYLNILIDNKMVGNTKSEPFDYYENEQGAMNIETEVESAKLEEGKLLKKIKNLKEQGKSTSEILRIIEIKNKVKKYNPASPSWYENPPVSKMTSEEFKKIIAKIQCCLKETLKPRERKIYILKKGLKGKPKDFKKISKLLKENISTIKSMYYRACRKLEKPLHLLTLSVSYVISYDKK